MTYYKITKIYNDKIALLEVDKSFDGAKNSILVDISLLSDFERHYSYKYNIANYSEHFGIHDKVDIQYVYTENTIKLYHATIRCNTEPKIKLFMPSVPESAPKNETSINRICLSDSIENCLNSISYGRNKQLEYELPKSIIRVYSIDVPLELGCLVYPNDVYNKYHVRDALFTNEYWWCDIAIFMSSELYRVDDFKCSYFYGADEYERDIFKNDVLSENLRTKQVFDEIDSIDFGVLLNYCDGRVYELNRLFGVDNFSLDLDSMFSFDIKHEISKFIKNGGMLCRGYVVKGTLKLREIKEGVGCLNTKLEGVVQKPINKSLPQLSLF